MEAFAPVIFSKRLIQELIQSPGRFPERPIQMSASSQLPDEDLRERAALEADIRDSVPSSFEVECLIEPDDDGKPTVTVIVTDSSGEFKEFGPWENYDFENNLAWRRVDAWLEETWVPERFQQNWETLKEALRGVTEGARTSTVRSDFAGEIVIQVTGGGQLIEVASIDPLKHGVMRSSDFLDITRSIREEVAEWNGWS